MLKVRQLLTSLCPELRSFHVFASRWSGISIGDTRKGPRIANLGWDKVRFPKPLFHGDTIHVQTEVIEVRESRSKPDREL